MLSQSLVMHESPHFTAGRAVLAPPSCPYPSLLERYCQRIGASPMSLSHARSFTAECLLGTRRFVHSNGGYAWHRCHTQPRCASGTGSKLRSNERAPAQHQHTTSTTSFLTTANLVYAPGAGITAAAGTRLALQWSWLRGLDYAQSDSQTEKPSGIVIQLHCLPGSGRDNFRACCLPWKW